MTPNSVSSERKEYAKILGNKQPCFVSEWRCVGSGRNKASATAVMKRQRNHVRWHCRERHCGNRAGLVTRERERGNARNCWKTPTAQGLTKLQNPHFASAKEVEERDSRKCHSASRTQQFWQMPMKQRHNIQQQKKIVHWRGRVQACPSLRQYEMWFFDGSCAKRYPCHRKSTFCNASNFEQCLRQFCASITHTFCTFPDFHKSVPWSNTGPRPLLLP